MDASIGDSCDFDEADDDDGAAVEDELATASTAVELNLCDGSTCRGSLDDEEAMAAKDGKDSVLTLACSTVGFVLPCSEGDDDA